MSNSLTNNPVQLNQLARAAALENKPGQPLLNYRLGTHQSFLSGMLERLSQQTIEDGEHRGSRPLASFGTRERDDPAVALLDAWACVADVLTFYQERIANEAYLRTATERRSVLELARAIGYELSPGVAASAWLVFQVDESPGVSTLPKGMQVMSIPGEGELPQTFETSEEFIAHAAWNELNLPPPVQQDQTIELNKPILLTGTGTGLQPGDGLLIAWMEREQGPESDRWCWLTVRKVIEQPEQQLTKVKWNGDIDEFPEKPRVFAFRQKTSLFGHNAPDWLLLPDESEVEGKNKTKIKLGLSKRTFVPDDPLPPEWPEFELQQNQIDLTIDNPRIITGSWIVLVDESDTSPHIQPLKVNDTKTVPREDYSLRAMVTRIVTDIDIEHVEDYGLRSTVVFAESEELQLENIRKTNAVEGDTMELLQVKPVPELGQALIFDTGEEKEVAFIDQIETMDGDSGRIRISLRENLKHSYDPETINISANVVRATHGETIEEILGSGDASTVNQRFKLRVPPLSYISAPTSSGTESTLSVYVNNIVWEEAASLHDLDDRSRNYTVRIDDEGVATLIFGDGEHGARLPSGQENVVAKYRSGIGIAGNVKADSLALLETRPFGVSTVTNLLPATAGSAKDSIKQARANAPRSVLTMDRLVSLRDYENFAYTFAGIGKAGAVVSVGEEGRLIHLTVAGNAGAELIEGSDLERSFTKAITISGDPAHSVRIESCRPKTFRLKANIKIHPDYHPRPVVVDVKQNLVDTFSFEQRDFGQFVSASEVIAVIQGVDGIIAVDLDELYLEGTDPKLCPMLPARLAHRNELGRIMPAELLLLDPDNVVLQEIGV